MTVRNTGDVALDVPSVVLLGPQATEFSVDAGTCTGPLAATATCNLEVRFAPTASGTRSASLRLQSSPGGTITVALAGTGQRPGAIVLEAAPGNPDFGTLVVGSSRVETFTLRNTGDLSAGRLLSITLGTGFSRESATTGECAPNVTVLTGGSSCTFRVRFQPQSAGTFGITLNATSQLAGSAGLFLSGVGQAPALLQGAGQLSFPGTTVVNEPSSPLNWVVTNAGGTSTPPLALTNTNTTEFLTTNQCNGALSAGSSCSVSVRFLPQTPGSRSGRLTLSAGNALTLSVNLAGIGTCPAGQENDGGTCRLSNGQTCSAANQCASGLCTAMYPDADGDGFGDQNASFIRRCGPVPSGFAVNNRDCCDVDALANPDQDTLQGTLNACASFDYNCDGAIEYSFQEATERFGTVPCNMIPQRDCQQGGGVKWTLGVPPACGSTGSITVCSFTNAINPASPAVCATVNGLTGILNNCK